MMRFCSGLRCRFLGAAALVLAASLAIAPPARAGTVVISTGGFAIGGPGFFLSIGQPFPYHPPVYAIPGPVPCFPAHPIYPYPHSGMYRHLYRVQVTRQPITFPNGLTLPDEGGPAQGYRTLLPAGAGIGPGGPGLTLPPATAGAIAPFITQPYPWLETADLSTTAPAAGAPPAPAGAMGTYTLSAPNPFNQSVGTLQGE